MLQISPILKKAGSVVNCRYYFYKRKLNAFHFN